MRTDLVFTAQQKKNIEKRKTGMKNDTDEDTVRENYSAGYMIVLPDEHDENNNMQKPDNTSDLHEDQEKNEHPGSGNDCVVDMKLQPSGSDSKAEMSSSSCDEHQKAVNDIEYHEDQCSKSFQDLQETVSTTAKCKLFEI